ncbi:hypothetical protein V6259_12670 [Marinomonas sp. TI.3.20]|uniref:hypothetical protein n=1 Tax=Marinomonas sp. TI.3.20 TaxID=3121296 RepID=UPI00311EA226
MNAKQIKELLHDDIRKGAIEVRSFEEHDFHFSLKHQILMLSRGVVYCNEKNELEIGFVIKRRGNRATEKTTFVFDGKGIVSSIVNSENFKALVRETNTPKHFFSSNAGLLKGLDRCQCENATEMNHRLIGFDLSFPDVPRKRGGLISIQCHDCNQWFLQPFYADTKHLKGSASLSDYISRHFSSSHIYVPPLSSIIDAPAAQYKAYSPYTSHKQLEENRKKISALKESYLKG